MSKASEKDQQAARKLMVAELYALGITNTAIAGMLGVRRETITRDVANLGVAQKFQDRPTKDRDVFRAVLLRYARLRVVKDIEDIDQLLVSLRLPVFLSSWLKENEILAFLRGVESTMRQLLVPAVPPDKQGYARLLSEVLHCSFSPAKISVQTAEEVWHNYLEQMVNSPDNVADSRQNVQHTAAAMYLAQYRAQIAPMLTDQVCAMVDAQLDTLAPREREILRKRFGIDKESAQTHQGVGEDEDVTRERIRQIESKALRKLRHPSRKRVLASLLEPVGEPVAVASANERQKADLRLQKAFVDQCSSLMRAAEPLMALLDNAVSDKRWVRGDNLSRSVDELHLNIRAVRCLRDVGILTIGDLVKKTERDLLRIKNFGRKSLREIKEILANMGLSLDRRNN